jgi:hypothetical protein
MGRGDGKSDRDSEMSVKIRVLADTLLKLCTREKHLMVRRVHSQSQVFHRGVPVARKQRIACGQTLLRAGAVRTTNEHLAVVFLTRPMPIKLRSYVFEVCNAAGC